MTTKPKRKTYLIEGTFNVYVSVRKEIEVEWWDKDDTITQQRGADILIDHVHQALVSGNYADPDIDAADVTVKEVKAKKVMGAAQ